MEWNPDECGRKLRDEFLLEQFADTEKNAGAKFFLYYFWKDAADRSLPLTHRPTVLFIPGGPGEVNLYQAENFGDLQGFRVVYFHLRGTGLSQLPADNNLDQYMRSRYVVDDIEKIRTEVLGNDRNWTGILAHSYGTTIAQRYAKKYGRVDKLILSAPLSRHDLAKYRETIQFESLNKLLESKSFKPLDRVRLAGVKDIRKHIAVKAEKVYRDGETEFGSIKYIIDNYDDLAQSGHLAQLKLAYSRAFFVALRKLRQTGWLSHDDDLAKGSRLNVDTIQRQAAAVITKGICGVALEQALLEQAETSFRGPDETSLRAYYVMSIYDGVNARFLSKFLTGAPLAAAIAEVGGRQHVQNRIVNTGLNKVGLHPEPIERWDPEKFAHAVPTLILEGGADPVTESGQAEYVFERGLTGDRVRIKLPGIGHAMAMPVYSKRNGNRFEAVKTRDTLLIEFLTLDTASFANSDPLKILRAAYDQLAAAGRTKHRWGVQGWWRRASYLRMEL